MTQHSKTIKKEIDELKREVRQQAIITRRTIVKTSQKNEEYSLRSKVQRQEKKLKQEQYLRRKYPSVNNAYKQYLMTMRLVKSK
jgi:hypothetical protein|tara:strand:+ start:1733 stop:1984 length:252 start_codon:yes stop_codon:yes gene_type:complete